MCMYTRNMSRVEFMVSFLSASLLMSTSWKNFDSDMSVWGVEDQVEDQVVHWTKGLSGNGTKGMCEALQVWIQVAVQTRKRLWFITILRSSNPYPNAHLILLWDDNADLICMVLAIQPSPLHKLRLDQTNKQTNKQTKQANKQTSRQGCEDTHAKG